MLKKLPRWLKNLQAKLSLQKKLNSPDTSSQDDLELPISVYITKYKKISMIICVLFILLFLLNSFLNFQLFRTKKILDDRYQRVLKYEDVEKSSTSLDTSLTRYKSLVSVKNVISDRFIVAYSSVPSDIQITSLNLNDKEFLISLKGENLISFATLLDTYVKSPLVSTIVLRDANYVTTSEEGQYFNVNILGTFK